jgi:hypothetical protein
MLAGTNAGRCSPERTDETPVQNPDDATRCACGNPADGYDARREEAVCERCAHLIADGGMRESTRGVGRGRSWPSEEWLRQAADHGTFTVMRSGETFRVDVKAVEDR